MLKPVVLIVLFGLSACGIQGDLYLPKDEPVKSADIATGRS